MTRIVAMPTDIARAYQNGAPDAYGRPPERAVSDGAGNPCRHCLRNIAAGDEMLILAHRPFGALQPYAETGPVFLCARRCTRHACDGDLPEALQSSPSYILRGYDRDERIVYGTGTVIHTRAILTEAARILSLESVDFVHVRSSRNNCFQARIEPDRAEPEHTCPGAHHGS